MSVDDRDLDILRWMYPEGVWSSWGTDPRITATQIASHVGLDRTAVWDRLRKWRREGFWDGFEVRLNFAIFDVGVAFAEIPVVDAAEGWALFDKLERVNGVVGSWLHHGTSVTARNVWSVAPLMVVDDPVRVARRMRCLRRLSPSGNVSGPYGRQAPRCSRQPTPLDWRIIAAIYANPNVSCVRAARLVGVTLKTFVRHRSALIDDHIVFYYPMVDWSKLGCVTLTFHCGGAADVNQVRTMLEARFPHLIPMSLEGLGPVGPPGDDPSCVLSTIVPAHSPHEVLTLVRDLSKVPGVRWVDPELWGRRHFFHGWVNQHIAEHLATAAAILPNAVSRSAGRKRSGRAAPTSVKDSELPIP